MLYRLLSTLIIGACISVAASPIAFAADTPVVPEKLSFGLTLKDHAFVPVQLTIPANKTIKLTIKNFDPTPAEFESDDFQAENVVPGRGSITIYIGPLKAGTYGFYDDFHEDDTKGTLIVQ